MAFLTKLREQAGAHTGDNTHKPFIKVLEESREHASDEEHPWLPILRKLKGHVVGDAERISTRDVFDRLEVPMKKRPGLTLQLSRLMSSLGWSHIRAHGLNEHAYLDRVRGYARPAPGGKALM
jgi:hypothetical protein